MSDFDESADEQRIVESGRADGAAHGAGLGFTEGEELGKLAGAKFGGEFGMMKGACMAWRHIATEHPEFCSAKAWKTLDALEVMLDAVPRTNVQTHDFTKDLDLCKARFKLLKSQLGADAAGTGASTPGNSKLSAPRNDW